MSLRTPAYLLLLAAVSPSSNDDVSLDRFIDGMCNVALRSELSFTSTSGTLLWSHHDEVTQWGSYGHNYLVIHAALLSPYVQILFSLSLFLTL